ncbi:avidin-related protein 4/5-like isoform X2 [Protopterus annectens]|uniref:avidin-related protein 4/5-like isoform X2 n=1 Tax=Protopterus annectens TaxID=7888 RepID=UPI001CF9ABC6|nr:avidin-related protein 4/5-like isoform X2 [Protopterus annectens]
MLCREGHCRKLKTLRTVPKETFCGQEENGKDHIKVSTSTTGDNIAPNMTMAPSLAGIWKNELGSILSIDEHDGNLFEGTYLTAVKSEETEDDIKLSDIVGFQQQDNSFTFGFTVRWSFSDSVTVFTGQYFPDSENGEILETMWLIRSNVDNHSKDWEATTVGKNTFVRWSLDKCSPEIVEMFTKRKN